MHARIVFGQCQTQLQRILFAGMSHLVQEAFIGNTGVSMAHRAPFMRHHTNFRCVVAFHSVIRNAVGGAIGEYAEGFLEAAVQAVAVHAVYHVGGVMLGVLHDGLADNCLVPR